MAQDQPAIPIVAAIPVAIRVAALDLFLFHVAKDRLVFWSDDVLPGRLLDFCYQHRLRIINPRLCSSEWNPVGKDGGTLGYNSSGNWIFCAVDIFVLKGLVIVNWKPGTLFSQRLKVTISTQKFYLGDYWHLKGKMAAIWRRTFELQIDGLVLREVSNKKNNVTIRDSLLIFLPIWIVLVIHSWLAKIFTFLVLNHTQLTFITISSTS